MDIKKFNSKIFGLSDLKGLIRESVYGEAKGAGSFDWAGYFDANPERVNMSFLKAMGLDKAPKEPMTIDQIGDSEMRKHFGDEKVAQILSDPRNFMKDQGLSNTYKTQVKRYRGASKAKTENPPMVILKNLFAECGGNNIRPNGTELDKDYFDAVRDVTIAVIEKARAQGFVEFTDNDVDANGNATKIEVGNVYDPFSLFLFFYFVTYFSARSGLSNIVYAKKREYSDNILNNYPEYSDIVDREVRFMNGGTIRNDAEGPNRFEAVREVIEWKYLSRYNMDFGTDITPETLSAIYENGNLSSNLQTLSDEIQEKILVNDANKGLGKIGGLVVGMLYLFRMSKDAKPESIKKYCVKSLLGENIAKFRGLAMRMRHAVLFGNVSNESIMSIARAFGGHNFDIDTVFDPLATVTLNEVHDAVRALMSNQRFNIEDPASFQAPFKYFASFGLPHYDNAADLCPAERVATHGRNMYDLMKESVVGKYGGGRVLNPQTVFIPAGEGLELLAGRNPMGSSKRTQILENVYGTEKVAEEWSFGDLVSYDYFGKDKAQKEVFYFLRANTSPDVVWDYEYNREEGKVDKELGNRSIDIMCRYGNNLNRIACFEYQGEQHFRPWGVTPLDEDANVPTIAIFNEIKNKILNAYISSTRGVRGATRWEDKTIYDQIMKDVYEETFRNLIQKNFGGTYRGFEDMYQVAMRDGTLRNVLRPSMNEAVTDRYVGDEELIIYMFCLLCMWNRMELPAAYRNLKIGADVYSEKKGLNSDIIFLASPYRFVQELHVYCGKISDREKSMLIKSRNWPIAYILPAGSSVTNRDVEETFSLANPEGSVFRWNNEGKSKLLGFAESIGIPIAHAEEEEMGEENTETTTLFEQIIREVLDGGSLQ